MADSSARFRALALAGVDELLAGLGPRLRPFLDAAAAASYHLTEAEYAENEADDPWVHRLLAAVDAALSWARPLLSTANNDALVAALVDSVAARLEAVVWQKRFNWLGGLQLERDVRTLVNQLSEQTARTVRDKFARLTQMATVLNVETAEEVLDFWGDNAGAITWRLTSVEVRGSCGVALGALRHFLRLCFFHCAAELVSCVRRGLCCVHLGSDRSLALRCLCGLLRISSDSAAPFGSAAESTGLSACVLAGAARAVAAGGPQAGGYPGAEVVRRRKKRWALARAAVAVARTAPSPHCEGALGLRHAGCRSSLCQRYRRQRCRGDSVGLLQRVARRAEARGGQLRCCPTSVSLLKPGRRFGLPSSESGTTALPAIQK